MAPVPGISKQAVVKMLRGFEGEHLTLDLGSPHRDCQIIFDGVMWSLCPMVTDPQRVEAVRKRRLAARQSFMVEHVVELQEPGAPLLAMADREAFTQAIEALPWRMGGPDLSRM